MHLISAVAPVFAYMGFQGRGALAFEVQIQIDVTIHGQGCVRVQAQFHAWPIAWIWVSYLSATAAISVSKKCVQRHAPTLYFLARFLGFLAIFP